MCAITAATDQHRFAIGSSSILQKEKVGNEETDGEMTKKCNEVHLISYSEDNNRIDTNMVFKVDHDEDISSETRLYPEVTQLSSSPYNRNILVVATSEQGSAANKAIFYKLPASLAAEEDDEEEEEIK